MVQQQGDNSGDKIQQMAGQSVETNKTQPVIPPRAVETTSSALPAAPQRIITDWASI